MDDRFGNPCEFAWALGGLIVIWRLLKRAGVSRLPSNMRYQSRQERFKRYEKPLPGHQLQVDVKFLAPVAGRALKTRLP